MRKKIAATAVAILLLLQTIVGTGWLNVQASGEGELTKNIITNAIITINYNDQTVTRSVYDQSDIELDFEWIAGSHIRLDYNWELPDDYHYDDDGHIFKFNLPEQFKLFSGSLQRRPVNMINEFGQEVTIAYFQATADNEVTLEIHPNVKDMYGVSGQMWFDASFDMDEFEYEWSQDIRIDIKDNEFIQFNLGFKPRITEAFTKTGAAKPGSYNSEYIEWTIDVNTVQEAVYGALVTDVFPSGLQLDQNSVKVYELKVSLDGSRTEIVRELDNNSEYHVTTSDPTAGFEVDLGDISRAYRIIYKTNIIDPNTTSFENTATFKHDGDAVGLTDKDTVNITRGELLAKRSSSYNSTTQTITWQIDYNFGLALLNPAVLRDDFGDNQEYVPGTLRVQKVTLDPEGSATNPVDVDSASYTFTPDANGFRLAFAGAIESEAYRITYQTKIIDPITKSTTITNTVKDEKYSEGGIGIGAGRPVGPVVLSKPCPPASKINYANRTIDWEIQLYGGINRMDQDVIVTDTIHRIMKFDESSLKVFNAGNVELVRGTDYLLQYNPGSGGFGGQFIVTFPDGVDRETYRITYSTDYEDLDGGIAKFSNNASISWMSNDANFSSGVYTSGLSVTTDCVPVTSVVNNGFKDGEYDADNQLINWQVGINYNSMSLADAIVWDNLGPVEDSQVYVEDSVRIYPMTVNSDGSNSVDRSESAALIDGEDYQVEQVVDNGVNLLKVSFEDTIDRPYLVTFQTTYQNSLINNAEVENIAWLTDGSVRRSNDLVKTVTIPFGGEYVSKTGNQDGDYIDWTIFINRGLSYIDAGAKLIDTPSTNQLLPDEKTAYRVFGTTVSGNGTVVVKNTSDQLVEGTDYDLEILLDENGHQQVVLEFKHAIEHKAYVLEYRSTIDAVHGEAVGNEVDFEGQRADTITKKGNGKVEVAFSGGGATGKGIIRKLEVTKVDAEDNNVKLEGAVFELRRETSKGSNIYVAFGDPEVTDENGVATFDILPSGNYQLWEVGAPEGYQLPVSHVGEFPVIATTKDVAIKVQNVKAAGTNKITVTKVDEDDPALKLENAQFRLERKVGLDWVAWGTAQTTDDEGKLEFTNLLPGEYRVIETVAPEGYLLNDTPKEVTITAGDEAVSFTNKARQLIVEKVNDNDHAEKLAGATFRLEKQDGSAWITVGTSMTDASGIATFKPLAPGDYRLIETAAPTGYLLDTTPIEVEIRETDVSVTKIATNEPIRHLTVIKADENDNTVTLAGAAFRLEMLSGGEWVEVGTGTTDINGEVVFSELRAGDYRLIETAAPTGYLLDGKPHEFSLLATEVNKSVTVTNEPNRKLTVTKVNENDFSQKLAGATFSLEMLDGSVWKEVDTGTTNANGELVFSELKPGDYRLIERSAPAGYVLNDTPRTVSIGTADVHKSIDVSNEPNRELKVTKVDENDTSITLEGATFFLELLTGGVWVGIDTGTTDANGEVVFTELKPGDYRLTETAAPTGYLLNDTQQQITIGATDLLTEVEFTNEPNRHLKVTKVDERQTSTVLAGAKFRLEKLDGSAWTVIGNGTTDARGHLEFSELEPGKYRLIETEAPERYVLNETPHEFTIAADASLTEVTITNRRISVPWIPPIIPGPEDPEDPEKPGDSEDPNDPEDPVSGEDPNDPVDRDDPEDPERPEQPSQPEDPTDRDDDERTVRERTEEATPVEGRIGLPEGSVVRLCQEPENGTVTFDAEGRWVYTPAPGFTGQDRFCVTVIDEDGNEEDLFFEIDVDEVPLGTVTVPEEQANQGGLLPKTGEESKLLYYVLGSLLITAGLAAWVIMSRKKSTSV